MKSIYIHLSMTEPTSTAKEKALELAINALNERDAPAAQEATMEAFYPAHSPDKTYAINFHNGYEVIIENNYIATQKGKEFLNMNANN